ncbi:phage regulatory CII family protein [Lysobacter korlensis]|uniref:Phage regulatory CII family protein n=1 Tax=Lysobacter korlensis TaxID=553636 RepID=A0ABV6RLQ0_9GAMM
MNVVDAAHQTVKSYPGGAESLGPRVGIGPAVLRSKVNPNTTTHHLTLAEASEVMGVTGDHRILHALAAEHGYTLQAIEAPQDGASILQAVLQANAAEGAFDRELQTALSDNTITANEARLVEAAWSAAQAAGIALIARVRSMSRGTR